MTTIRVCPLKSPKVRNPICKGNGTSADSLGHAADVWGSKSHEFLSSPAATAMILPIADDLVLRITALGCHS
jgi:hypothetical protein